MFTQKFKLSSVKTNLMGSGLKAGEYDMHGSYAINFQAEGNLQTLSVEIPAIEMIAKGELKRGSLSAQLVGGIFPGWNPNVQ